jgi:NifU-like protein involved in Fe-S cluster formation
MVQPLYTTDILRLAASLPLETSLAYPHGRAERRSRTCGSVVATEVTLDSAGRVTRLAQQVQACAFGQASAALVQAAAVGRTAEELRAERGRMAAWLSGESDVPRGFEVLEPARTKSGRHDAMLLPFDAVIAALENVGTTTLDFARDERGACGEGTP